MQGRAAQVRDSLLQGIEAVIERQQRLFAKEHDGGFFERSQDGGGGCRAAHRLFGCGAAAPLTHRPWGQAQALG